MTPKSFLKLAPLPFLAAGLPALAQSPADTQLAEVVVTATRVPTPVERVPASVNVVTREVIGERAYQTLPEALSTLPGVTVVRSGGIGSNASVFLRGANSDHVLVLVDGLPANDPSLAAGAFNFGDDTLGGFERIEVVRGPASTLYGSNAIGGVVNLITRAGGDSPASPEVDVGVGTDGTWRGTAGLYGSAGAADYGLSVEGLTTDGQNNTPKRLRRPGTGDKDGAETVTATAKGVYTLGFGTVEGLVRYRDAQFDLDSVPSDEPNYEGESENLTWQVAGTAALWKNQLTSRLAVGQTIYDRSFTDRPDANDSGTSDDRYEGTRSQLDWQNSLAVSGAPELRDIVLTGGLTLTREDVEFSTLSVSAFGPFSSAVDERADSLALFAQAQARAFGFLDLSAGVRHDRPDDYGSRTTWRVGAVAAVAELPGGGEVRLKGNVGTAFKAPTLYDRFGTNSFRYVGNPNLRPEKSTGYEAGVEADVAGLGRDDLVRAGVVYFRNDIKDLITFQYNADFSSTVVNVGKADSEGVEATLALRPADGVELAASWTWTDARNDDTGIRLLRRPEHALAFTARLEPVDGLMLSPELTFVGQRLDATYADNGNFLGTRGVGGYWLANLAATYQVTEGWSLYARGSNLLDRRIENPSGFAQPGASALAGVRGRF
ncbi:TonB-dependent receptor [Aerophototrophica crusticola]|uniref:TonB-dependent receptor n=1 Tax=Aerophototrophica crusticola TaxID=1709002 RepID=A0A858R459_9PROT|nr:TonB-dependent receptor [Rhodospirillaceae bacterium B3]